MVVVGEKGRNIMGIYKREDVVAVEMDNGEVRCIACMRKEDWEGVKGANLITAESIEREEKIIVCNECDELIDC